MNVPSESQLGDFFVRHGKSSVVTRAESVAVVEQRSARESNLANTNDCGNDRGRRLQFYGDKAWFLFPKCAQREQVPVEILKDCRVGLYLELLPQGPEAFDFRDGGCKRDPHSRLEERFGARDVAAD